MKKRNAIALTAAGVATGVAGAAAYLLTRPTIPQNACAIEGFDAEKYLGKWHEIARFNFRFEKELSNVTAEYSLNEDGSIRVVNRGYDKKKKKWHESDGKALFVKNPTIAMLKVSFFGPFYSGYNVAAIDKGYKYALVLGRNLNYLWLLSREKTMPQKVKEDYLDFAEKVGYDLSKVVWTEQK